MIQINSGDNLLKVLEAFSNPHRLMIIAVLSKERKYVSQLARELGISRPLLYLHLQKLEEVEIVSSTMEISESGKAMKYYSLQSFQLEMNEQLMYKLSSSLTFKSKKARD